MSRILLAMALLGVAAVSAACGDDDSGAEPGVSVRPDSDHRVEIVADSVEWNVDEIVVGVGETFTIDHVNLDAEKSMSHNIHVRDAPGSPKTDLEAVDHQELTLTLDEEGSYEFVCDLHANMRGTIEVVPTDG